MAQRNATQLGQRLKETIPDYDNSRAQVAQALGMLAEDLPSPPQDVAMAVIRVSLESDRCWSGLQFKLCMPETHRKRNFSGSVRNIPLMGISV